jgi:Rad3-related DNA helicase
MISKEELFKYKIDEGSKKEEIIDNKGSKEIVEEEWKDRYYKLKDKYYTLVDKYSIAVENIVKYQEKYDDLVERMEHIEEDNKKINIALNCDGYQD